MTMRGLFLFLSLFLVGVLAQDDFFTRIPSCAAQCLMETLPTTKCSPTDFPCLCADTQFMGAAAACNAASCTMVEVLRATNETYAACGVESRDQSSKLIGIVAATATPALLMVILRLLDRGRERILGYDDLLIGLAGAAAICMNVPALLSGTTGFGRDIWSLKPEDITLSIHYMYYAYIAYMVTECLCQLSLLSFTLRLLVDKKVRYYAWFLVGLTAAYGLTNAIVMVFQCTPISGFWHGWKGETPSKCIDINLFAFVRGGLQIGLDLAILTLPLPMVFRLQLSLAKKLRLFSMFCVGFLITIVSCLRLASMVKFSKTTNPTYDNTSGIYWCGVEANLFLIVACMPALHSIIRKFFGRPGTKNSSKGTYALDASQRRQKSGGSLPFGTITKATKVDMYYTERSNSESELVDRPSLA